MIMKVGVLYNTIKSSKLKEVEEDLEEFAINVIESLSHHGHDVVKINADKNFFSNIQDKKLDFVFNICERFENDYYFEPHVAGMLELAKIPFTGSDSATLNICNNKVRSKEILIANNIPTPKFQVFHSHSDKLDSNLEFPLIVKPKQQENSIGITENSIVYDGKSLRNRIKYVREKFNEESLVEEFIKGDDVEISIIGNGNDLMILPFAKVGYEKMKKIPEDKIFSYHSKWETESDHYGDYVEAKLPSEITEKIKEISIKVFRLFNIKDYGRVDFRLTKDHKPYVIEVTANPGLSKCCSTLEAGLWIGMDHKEIINKIFEAARKRYGMNETNN